MKSKTLWKAAGRVYDNVEAALWTLLIVFLIYFFVFVMPKLLELWARNEAIRVLEISSEDGSYCARLGLDRSAESYPQCLLVLGEFRAKVEKRITAEESF